MKKTLDKDTARDQARAQLDCIVELVKALDGGEEVDGEELTREEVEERIHEHPLSVEVRADWHAAGAEDKLTEYNILLCTGGPAVRIIGDLSQHGEPETARIEYQDWFTPWKRYGDTSHAEEEAMLIYARQFYYLTS